jgi:pyruvate formate lyase activating enzyme
MDADRHEDFTGVANAPIVENLQWLAERGASVTVRLPLFPGINDDEQNLRAMSAFLVQLDRSYPVDILPYHRTGVDKYARLGRSYTLTRQQPPSAANLKAAVRLFEESGLNVTVRGESYVHEH